MLAAPRSPRGKEGKPIDRRLLCDRPGRRIVEAQVTTSFQLTAPRLRVRRATVSAQFVEMVGPVSNPLAGGPIRKP
jgi:hypothetical protein